MVNLVRDGQPVRMSKRAGTVITLDDLVDALGVDAARYALIRSSVDTTIDIDLALWSSRRRTKTRSTTCNTRMRGCRRWPATPPNSGVTAGTAHLDLLTHDKEGTLIRNLGEFPRVLETAAALREPHRVCRYLEDLAGDYHRFYDSCRVLPQGDEQPTDLHTARLALCQATRQVIANGLTHPRRHRTGAHVNAHPAGPRHAEEIHHGGAPAAPAAAPRKLLTTGPECVAAQPRSW